MPTKTNPLKPVAKRSQRACDCCKIAKVRCNVLEQSPCGYCTSKDIKCIVDKASRRRTFRRRRRPSIPGPLVERHYGASSPGCITTNTQLLKITPQLLGSTKDLRIYTSGRSIDQDSLLFEWSKVGLSYPEIPSSNTVLSSSVEEGFWEMFTNLDAPASFASGGSDFGPPLPAFIRAFSTTIGFDSIEYLQAHGALTLPSIALQDALLQKFVECVLPCMPILDWPGFINIINARDGSQGQVSLLLFQAVMFSATTFVELEYLLEAGYSNREEAHEGFFEKAKLLYYSDYESDALAIVQSLLLLTNRSDTADVANSKHWSEIAISVAEPIGLFQDQASAENPLYCPRMWRRVGWACYMTDCLIALRLRRRPSIKSESFGHQMLTADDFDIDDIPSDNEVLDREFTLLYDVETRRQLNLGTIAQARLCVCIREVLEIQGKNDQLNWSITANSPDLNSPNDGHSDSDYIAKVASADKALEDWMNSLPSSCQYRLPDAGAEWPTIFVQRSLLHMIYHTATCVLHQSQTFSSSKYCVHHAARQITHVASELHNRNLHNCLPRIGVTAILVAMIIHISQVKSVSPLERQEVMDSFQACITVMASLQEVHSETKAVTACMLRTMEKTAKGRDSGSQKDDNSTFCDLEISTSPFIAIPSEASVPLLADGVQLNNQCKDEQILDNWDMYLII